MKAGLDLLGSNAEGSYKTRCPQAAEHWSGEEGKGQLVTWERG